MDFKLADLKSKYLENDKVIKNLLREREALIAKQKKKHLISLMRKYLSRMQFMK